MAELFLDGISKSFGARPALQPSSLAIPDGKLVCFLGPSGCGKTTLLRIIAGLERPDAGRLLLNGHDVTDQPAHRRGFGMVFQSLVLFPHMTIAGNVNYPLRLRGTPSGQRRRRVEELLRLLRLEGRGEERVQRLSGGERQRVAIARALAADPKLLLLDEPFSALDAKLREALQVEVRLLQQRLGITAIMVTHDQREAMTMADIVVVMGEHRIQQVAPPQDVYHRPSNAFVAAFIGAGNLLPGVPCGTGMMQLPGGLVLHVPPPSPAAGMVLIRPEHVRILPEGSTGLNCFPGRVTLVRELGSTAETIVQVGEMTVIALAMSAASHHLRAGMTVDVELPPSACQCLQ